MISHKKIRVLIVDDSKLFRQFLEKGITNSFIEVVASASDAFEAEEKLLKYKPDVMLCDIEMPKMNGIEFIKKILPRHPLPVIVISGVREAVFDALNAGAVEFVAKPSLGKPQLINQFFIDLVRKIKAASMAKMSAVKIEGVKEPIKVKSGHYEMIAIGASTGGTEALYHVLKNFSTDSPGIVVVQHIPPLFSKMFAERLNTRIGLFCKEAETGDSIERGKVLIAQGAQHMRVKKRAGKYYVEVYEGEKVSGHSPSVDVLFNSVAEEVGRKAIGIILTGMGQDGAKGLYHMREKGAKTIGQDEQSCVVYGMPKVAFKIGAVEKQLPLERIHLGVQDYLNGI